MTRTKLLAAGALLALMLAVLSLSNLRNGEGRGNDALALPAGAAQPLALFGTIPIYWGETESMEEMLNGTGEPHWARAVLEQRYALTPLDTLDENSLDGVKRLLMAQPRALSPAENVVLDGWVRGGGHLLLFADPMMTAHSHFGLGDKRRPQDVVLLSPIMARWGLALEYDEQQPSGYSLVRGVGEGMPINLSGRFATTDGDRGPDTHCELTSEKLIAECSIGDGTAVIMADAAILDEELFATPLMQLASLAFERE